MKVQFNIDYYTHWGQRVYVCGSIPELGNWDPEKALALEVLQGEHWRGETSVSGKVTQLSYKYFIRQEEHTEVKYEWGTERKVSFTAAEQKQAFYLKDFWRAKDRPENAFFTSAFQNALLKPAKASKTKKKKITLKKGQDLFRFQISAARVPEGHKICLLGSSEALGGWAESKALVLEPKGESLWQAEVALNGIALPVEYKYGLYDTKAKKITAWEQREFNRVLFAEVSEENSVHIISDEEFSYPMGPWRGAGVAIPVFSLRTRQGMGVGEFLDLKVLADWSEKVGLKLIQILPINDTVAEHTWMDSYPYSAISVFALHPMYLNMEALGKLASKTTQEIISEVREKLNKLDTVDYDGVMRIKRRYIKMIYDETKEKFFADKDATAFMKENGHWLKPYAAFSYLRDLYGTPDFKEWGAYADYDQKKIEALCKPGSDQFDDIAVHFYSQYHLHKQLLEAADYARSKGIVLKGDIPIGIYRYSVDAWMEPRLYNMDCQAGAPPDGFAVNGQNWGFPTYNWEEMAKDGYAWWKSRMTNMSKYFDAFRIDHILGFFRIWEIPWDNVQGILGYFNPCLAVTADEIQHRGIHFDYERFVKPYIREHYLFERFGENTAMVKETYLEEYHPGFFRMKPEFDTQRKVETALATDPTMSMGEKAQREKLKEGLFGLIAEVLFIELPNGQGYSPRISMHFTRSFQDLDDYTKAKLDELYIDFYYHRQEWYWREQAMIKLPALKEATNMLICGEDLGMVPDCVPPVMDDLGILSLEIQRMPKNPKVKFGHPADAPYMSVVTPSCHDMSTIRGWWEEDSHQTQEFYNQILGHWGGSPFYCEPWIAREMVNQHLWSPAMWAIFPIQDLVAIDERLRREDAQAEQINVPANPNHYWRYRFHMNLEDLIEEEEFNEEIRQLISESGRA
ncbi:4-alpha-glucanotransferase [Persicobacter diffluens]|uniref:4-alpha-glucanotransferase n=1 Tax=Persicobacter diffluens TaxID=981 RepID=A0AAN5AM18_9BACT|nr:4-alpha-glucanotransferase [Persicobacter diffluens]